MDTLSASTEEYHMGSVFCGKGNTKWQKWRSIGEASSLDKDRRAVKERP
jgi:hypothetical protein